MLDDERRCAQLLLGRQIGPDVVTEDRMQMVLYPKSRDIMRAARRSPGTGFVNDTLYW